MHQLGNIEPANFFSVIYPESHPKRPVKRVIIIANITLPAKKRKMLCMSPKSSACVVFLNANPKRFEKRFNKKPLKNTSSRRDVLKRDCTNIAGRALTPRPENSNVPIEAPSGIKPLIFFSKLKTKGPINKVTAKTPKMINKSLLFSLC